MLSFLAVINRVYGTLQHRTAAGAEHLGADAAKHIAEIAAAAGAHNDQTDVVIQGGLDDGFGSRAAAQLAARGNPVFAQLLNDFVDQSLGHAAIDFGEIVVALVAFVAIGQFKGVQNHNFSVFDPRQMPGIEHFALHNRRPIGCQHNAFEHHCSPSLVLAATLPEPGHYNQYNQIVYLMSGGIDARLSNMVCRLY